MKLNESEAIRSEDNFQFVDAGGTPAFVINNKEYARIKDKNIVLVLDPIDLSRVERTIIVDGNKIKFQVDAKDVSLSADSISVRGYSGKVSSEFRNFLDSIIKESKNLRDLMNSLVKYFAKDMKVCLLEEVLISINSKIAEISKQIKIPVRAICPVCNRFVKINLGEKTCCGVNKEIIETGRYVPQGGYFRPLLLLAGIIPSIPNAESVGEFEKRCIELNIEPKYVMVNNKNAEGED